MRPAGEGLETASAGPHKVLVVDDERDLADLAEALLCSHGIQARSAYSSAEALRILENDPAIDAVFSDIMMPGMTGLQLADAITVRYPRIKIVLATGFTLPVLLDRHDRHPCATKPYLIDTIIRLLRS